MKINKYDVSRETGGSGQKTAVGGSVDLSSLMSQLDYYVLKEFWNTLFELRDSQNNVLGIDDDLTDLATIVAKYDFASVGAVSALGIGGGGGGVTLSEPLASINSAGLGTPSAVGQTLIWDGSGWTYGVSGGGSGSVTSVAMTVPTGFSINGTPITSSGTLALSFDTGYSLPTTAKQDAWDDAVIGLSMAFDRIATLEGYFTGGKANSAAQADRLSGTNSYTVWGQTYWQNGVPKSVTGNMSSVGNITMSGKITMGSSSFVIEVDSNGDLKFNGDIYATGSILAAWGDITGKPTTISGYGITDAKINTSTGAITLGSNTITPVTVVSPTSATSGYVVTHGSISGKTLTLQTASLSSMMSNFKWWGQSLSNGVVNGDMTGVGHISMSNNKKVKIYDNAANSVSVLTIDSSGNFIIGETVDTYNINTYIRGNNFLFQSGGSNRTEKMRLDSSGRLWIKEATQGLRIGDGLLTWDATNNALKVSKSDGSAAHLYALGGISALGFNSGSGSTNSATIGTLNVTGQLNMATETRISTPENLYIGNDHSEGYVYMADMASQAGANKWRFGEEGTLFVKNSISVGTDVSSKSGYTGGFIQSPRFYLDNTRYLHLDGNVLMYFDGLTDRTVPMS